jgi:hypothetical protein
MAFVSPPLAIPNSLGTHTGFDERPSPGMILHIHTLLVYGRSELVLCPQTLITHGYISTFIFSAGGAAWAEPDPLAVEHDALLRTVLAKEGITQADLDAGKAVHVLSSSCLILPLTDKNSHMVSLSWHRH